MLRSSRRLPVLQDVHGDVVRRVAAEALPQVSRQAAARRREHAAVRPHEVLVAARGDDFFEVAPAASPPPSGWDLVELFHVNSRASFEQHREGATFAKWIGLQSRAERRPVRATDGIRVGAKGKEASDRFNGIARRRDMQRLLFACVFHVDLAACIEQKTRNSSPALGASRFMEGRITSFIHAIDICASRYE